MYRPLLLSSQPTPLDWYLPLDPLSRGARSSTRTSRVPAGHRGDRRGQEGPESAFPSVMSRRPSSSRAVASSAAIACVTAPAASGSGRRDRSFSASRRRDAAWLCPTVVSACSAVVNVSLESFVSSEHQRGALEFPSDPLLPEQSVQLFLVAVSFAGTTDPIREPMSPRCRIRGATRTFRGGTRLRRLHWDSRSSCRDQERRGALRRLRVGAGSVTTPDRTSAGVALLATL